MSEVKPEVAAVLERIRARHPKLQKIELKSIGEVYLRKPTGEDQLRIATLKNELATQKLERLPTSVFAASMGAVLLRNSDGTLLFEDANVGFNELNAMDGEDLLELHDQIMKICGLDRAGRKAVEDAEKKSSSGQSSEPGTN